MRKFIKRLAYIAAMTVMTATSHGAIAASLVDKVTEICIQQSAVPTYLDDDQTPEFCRCEAEVLAKRGTEAQLRSIMTFMTDDRSHLKGEKYSYDETLDFIASHRQEVEAKCAP